MRRTGGDRLTVRPGRAQRRQPGFGAYAKVAGLLGLFSTLCPIAIAQKAPVTDAGAAGADELRLAKDWNDSAEQYMHQGAYEEARKLYLRSLPVLEKTIGLEQPATAATLGNLCIASSHNAHLNAKPVCTRALSVREKVFGPNHPEVARSLSDLGLLYAKEGDLARADSLLRRALRIDGSLPDSPDTPGMFNNLGFLYFKERKYALAENAFERAIASTERNSGADDPDLITMLDNLATVNLAHHQPRAAEEHFLRALAIAERTFGPDQITSVRALIGLARAETALGRSSAAETFRQRARSVVGRDRQAYLEWGAAAETPNLDLRH